MGKTIKGKDKAARKIAAKKRKVARKTKRGAAAVAVMAFALSLFAVMLTGCATSEAQQPAKSQTQNNEFNDCTIVVASKVSLPIAGTNQTITAEGEELPTLELFTQTQSLESTGSTETITPTATQTPTTDVKPDLDVRYNDAVGTGGNAAAAFLSSLTSESFAAVKDYIANKKSGEITVTKTDGTTETLKCADGTCTYSGGSITADDCEACTAK